MNHYDIKNNTYLSLSFSLCLYIVFNNEIKESHGEVIIQ